MNWNQHSVKDEHAMFPPSQPAWLRYDEAKLRSRYETIDATKRGTLLHEHAANCIKMGTKLADYHQTLNMYVNDAIGYEMSPERLLMGSPHFYGTADSILFDDRTGTIRVHDYKSGVSKVYEDQVNLYIAYALLEYGDLYGMTPEKCTMEGRIYQTNGVKIWNPDPEYIRWIMNVVKTNEILLSKWESEK